MNTTYLAIAAIFILCRMPFHFKKRTLLWPWHLGKAGVECIAILFLSSTIPGFLWAASISLLATAAEYGIESRKLIKGKSSPYQERVCLLVGALFLLALYVPHAGVPPLVAWLLNTIKTSFPQSALQGLSFQGGWHDRVLIVSGILLLLVETNVFVRFIITRLDLEPQATQASHLDQESLALEPASTPSNSAYQRGWLIGIAERLLILYCALLGRYEMAAFMLTAKGIVRYKKINEEDFGEYFLVGTLLSVIIAGIVGLGILALLNAPLPLYLKK